MTDSERAQKPIARAPTPSQRTLWESYMGAGARIWVLVVSLSDSQRSVTCQDSTNDLARSLRRRSGGRRGIRLSGEKDAVVEEQRLTLVQWDA